VPLDQGQKLHVPAYPAANGGPEGGVAVSITLFEVGEVGADEPENLSRSLNG
jgi:hypothetical protein